MASYFDELGIAPDKKAQRQNRHDADLDDFMTPASSAESQRMPTNGNTEQLEQFLTAANFFGRFQQQMRAGGDHDQEQFLDNLVSQLLEESQATAKGPPPASQRFITALPTIKKSDISCEETCIICKETLRDSDGNVTRMPCGHLFDLDCLEPWLKLHHTCPMCRHQVESEQQAKEEEEEEARGWMYG